MKAERSPLSGLLGIPAELRTNFKHWSDAIVVGQEVQGMTDYFTRILEERREFPQNDLISALLTAEVDGQRLSSCELKQGRRST